MRYREEKAAHGAPIGNQNAANQSSQTGNIESDPKRTCDVIAGETGVSKNTVIRAEEFADAVDMLAEVEGEAGAWADGSWQIAFTEIC